MGEAKRKALARQNVTMALDSGRMTIKGTSHIPLVA